MSAKHVHMIHSVTQQAPEEIYESIEAIYEKTATTVLEHFAKDWDMLKDEVKLEIGFLNAGKENIIQFLALMEELNKEYKSTLT